MQKTILIVLSVITLALASLGWAGSPHGGRGLKHLSEALHLDAQQTEQVTQILQEQRDKRETLHETLQAQIRADMQALHQETLERLRPLLSAEQLQKFIQLSEERRARHARRSPRHVPPAPAQ
ncbi:MAG: hypothetical protein AB7N91_04835 [Candidatus Tectimicrobiota bacterium]